MFTDSVKSNRENVIYNTMAKTYLDGSKQIISATKRVFIQSGWEGRKVDATKTNGAGSLLEQLRIQYALEEASLQGGNLGMPLADVTEMFADLASIPAEWLTEEQKAAILKYRRKSVHRAMRRARVKVRDYALSTDMKYFVTLTLDKAKINRYDIHEITKVLNMWLNHQVERRGLTYVMVPELHADGAIHFHALFNGALEAVDSGTIIPFGEDKPRRPRSAWQRADWLRRGGRIVYNLPGWPYGFTTALELEGNYEKAVNYVCKYISKGLNTDADSIPVKVGGRWYYSGGDLGHPEVEFFNANMEDLECDFGNAARRIHAEDLVGVDMIVVWINPDGVPREQPRTFREVCHGKQTEMLREISLGQ